MEQLNTSTELEDFGKFYWSYGQIQGLIANGKKTIPAEVVLNIVNTDVIYQQIRNCNINGYLDRVLEIRRANIKITKEWLIKSYAFDRCKDRLGREERFEKIVSGKILINGFDFLLTSVFIQFDTYLNKKPIELENNDINQLILNMHKLLEGWHHCILNKRFKKAYMNIILAFIIKRFIFKIEDVELKGLEKMISNPVEYEKKRKKK